MRYGGERPIDTYSTRAEISEEVYTYTISSTYK
jgi:hypothetical protein